jgi:hypothetical protein
MATQSFAEDEEFEVCLEQALNDGFASGIAEGDVFARVRERAGLPPRDAAEFDRIS